MKVDEIELLAKGYASCHEEQSFSEITNGYIAGATMVNERQPYSAEDMKKFAFFVRKNVPTWVTINDDVIKLWEESKNV